MASIGEELRRERQRRGLTYKDVEGILHIREAYLAALEANQFTTIPGDVYVKGFIRSYAKFLELDSDRLIRSYCDSRGESAALPLRHLKATKIRKQQRMNEEEKEKLAPNPKRLTVEGRARRRQKTRAQERMILGAILLFILLFLFWLFFA